MSVTKDKILDTTLALFNEQGIETVTVRHIAQVMGISHGNLQYHFANTDLIIQALYDRLAARFDELLLAAPEQLTDEFDAFRNSIETSYKLIYEFRFIFLHFVAIGRRVPAIVKHYRKNLKKRKPQFMHLFGIMQQKGIMRKDIPAEVLDLFIYQLFIVSDFWISSNAITLQLSGKKAVDYYNKVCCNMFYPYLTPKGIGQLAER